MIRPENSFLVGKNAKIDLVRPCVMGILNVTPDSFYDGGRYVRLEQALGQARKMVAEGAAIIDVGGESSRPGAEAITAEEELERVIPVVEHLHAELPVPLSVDTWKSVVAREALAVGVDFVNDVGGLWRDPAMVKVVAEAGAGLFIMHARGTPREMQQLAEYGDVVGEVRAFLKNKMDLALSAGIPQERIALDPGIGFAKNPQDNLELLGHLREFRTLQAPLLLGVSRKSFLGTLLGRSRPEELLSGTLATIALGVAAGVKIFRVHDVQAVQDAVETAWAICRQGFAPENGGAEE
ncbi:MAG: dihydropteroate synthase [bacterium]|nr:dihydropteroate synthase [bacterium]